MLLSIILPIRNRFVFTTNFIPSLIYGKNTRDHELIIVLDTTEPTFRKDKDYIIWDNNRQKEIKSWLKDHKEYLEKHFKLKIIETGENDSVISARNKWVNASKIGLEHASNEFVLVQTCEHIMLTKNFDVYMTDLLHDHPDKCITFPMLCPIHQICGYNIDYIRSIENRNCPHLSYGHKVDYNISIENREKMRVPYRYHYCFPIDDIKLGIEPLNWDQIIKNIEILTNNDFTIERCGLRNYGSWSTFFIKKDIISKCLNIVKGSQSNDLDVDTCLGHNNVLKLISWRGLTIHINYPVYVDIPEDGYKNRYKPIYDFKYTNICNSC